MEITPIKQPPINYNKLDEWIKENKNGRINNKNTKEDRISNNIKREK